MLKTCPFGASYFNDGTPSLFSDQWIPQIRERWLDKREVRDNIGSETVFNSN